jgi:AcrR family transcriptional regulator
MITTDRTAGEKKAPRGSNGDKALQIVKKGIELFNRLGYERAKVSDITDALQMGKGTFYLYFKNKKELLFECFRQLDFVISSLESSPEVRSAGGFFERLRPRFAGAHEHYVSLAGTINLIRLCSESADPEIRRCAQEAYRAIIDPLKRDLEIAIQQGVARTIDAELAISGLIGFGESIVNRTAQDDRYTVQEIDDLIIDFAEKALRAFQNQDSSRALTTDRHVFSARITDRNGVCTEVNEIRFDGGVKLRGILGQAEIEVDPARVTSIAIRAANEAWFADLTTRDGGKASLQVQPNLIISGEITLGMLRIALSDISLVAFGNAQP